MSEKTRSGDVYFRFCDVKIYKLRLMTKTLDHYNQIASQYTQTNHALAEPLQELTRFLNLLRHQVPASQTSLSLLDTGSGSGRDTLAMLKAGCQVKVQPPRFRGGCFVS